jgi:hypothetical protein
MIAADQGQLHGGRQSELVRPSAQLAARGEIAARDSETAVFVSFAAGLGSLDPGAVSAFGCRSTSLVEQAD